MLTGINRSATFSPDGGYRLKLIRAWDGRPMLLVVMFNPSEANGERDDPTVSLLCHIAAHNGFGGIVAMNGVPLVSPFPDAAAYLVNTWAERSAFEERDVLMNNLADICTEVSRAGAVLIAWGALAERCPEWFDHVREEIEAALPEGAPLFCLGKTAGGHPKHPLARGKHKVRKDAPLIPWASARGSVA